MEVIRVRVLIKLIKFFDMVKNTLLYKKNGYA